MTEKLYYKDSHLKEFDAVVVSCVPEGERYAVILDRTAFFPGGGGQLADRGYLGDNAVLDAAESGEDVVHYLASPLAPGDAVCGRIDWPERFRRMQEHSGEHIISGIAHSLFDCRNVGFHLGGSSVILDFDRELTETETARLERLANETVWRDLPVGVTHPSPAELAGLEYRSKKELAGMVRIVTIPGVDVCACCAPHVSRTGEVGVIRIVDSMRHRGGIRLTAVAGRDAYEYLAQSGENLRSISRTLSAPPMETAAAVSRVCGELGEARRKIAFMYRDAAAARAAALEPVEGNICLFEPDMDMDALRVLVNGAMGKCHLCAAFTGSDGDYKYIIGSEAVDLKKSAHAINAAIEGRGGGSQNMIQGTAAAERAVIEEFFSRFAE